MLHHNWDTCREEKAQNAICPHNKETWALSESQKAALWKWFLLRSERCWGGNQVREREGLPGRRNGLYKELAIYENIEWEEQTCQDWTFKEFIYLVKLMLTGQWIQGGTWSVLWKT